MIRPDLKHFMTRDLGDSGTLHTGDGDVEFEVIHRDAIPMAGAQTMIRLSCRGVLTGWEFKLESSKLINMQVDWD